LLRLYCVEEKLKYLFSFFGLIDLLSILPSYLSLVIPGTQGFLILRAIRLLRVFRILKLNQYTKAGQSLSKALKSSIPKIIVFLMVITTLVIILGTLIYFIEGKENGFTSIPKGVYWAVVTMTTVGYGDITPKTKLGQMLSSLLMIVGYGIIAVPTGLVSVEIAKNSNNHCPHCQKKL
jgi:voltage-gated potassium channel